MWKIARAYVRALAGWTEDEQEAEVRAYADEHGLDVTVIRESDQGRALWLRLLRNGDRRHVAIVPSLEVVPVAGKRGKGRPTTDLAAVLAVLGASAPLIVDVRGEVDSAKPAKWAAHVRATVDRLAAGRRLKPEAARKMVAKRWAPGKPRGVAADWSAPWRVAELDRARDVWMSDRYTSDEAALDAINADLTRRGKTELVIGSTATARRVFGRRRR